MAAVLDALRGLGVAVDDDGRGTLPFTVHGTGSVRGGPSRSTPRPRASSSRRCCWPARATTQGVDVRHDGDARALAAPHRDDGRLPARARRRGRRRGAEPLARRPRAPSRATDVDDRARPVQRRAVPDAGPDHAAAGCTIPGWPRRDHPGRRRAARHPGADGRRGDPRRGAGSPSPAPARSPGIDVDLHDVGELAPAVAALCALADSPSRLRGIAHIRGHETDRLTALAVELTRPRRRGRGARPTGCSIAPAPLHGGEFKTYADHRMAHAAVIVGSAVDGVLVENVATTAKTFPGFADVWAGACSAS